MVAPAGKAPAHRLSAEDKKKIEHQRRRDRRVRRSNEPEPRRLPSIKIRQALKAAAAEKAAAPAKASTEEPATTSDEEARKPAADDPATTAPATSAVTTAEAKASRALEFQKLFDMLGPSDEEDEDEEDQLNDADDEADDPAPAPASPTPPSRPPTSEPTSSSEATNPPTSEPTTTPTPPTSEPTSSAAATNLPTSKPTSTGKRKRVHTGETSDEDEDSSGEKCDVDDSSLSSGNESVSNDPSAVAGGDPCLTDSGKAQLETVLDSESEDSSSEISEFDEPNELDWEFEFSRGDEDDDGAEELPDSEFLQTATNKAVIKDMRNTVWKYDPEKFGADPTYACIYDGPFGPSPDVMRVAEDPLALFFFFLPPQLWRQITKETNTYHMQNIEKRVTQIRKQQKKADPSSVENRKDLRLRLRAVAPVKAFEILRVIGLLIARMLCPHAKGLSGHWRKSQHGAVPVGTFGQWLSRNRFDHVMQNLHFTNNRSPQAKIDRGWKVRSVVTTLQKTFARGYTPGPVIAFDEAIIPTRSRRNPTRQYLPQKPHKWGTKFFAACCGETAYCMRIELYVGAKSHLAVPPAADNSCGAAAVVRNMNVLIPRSTKGPFRLIITDRYYTSVVLALELLHRRLYLTGTIQTRRAGFAKDIITKKKVYSKRPSDPPRGTVKLAENKKFPQITASMWMDNHPVHMISSGGSRSLGPVYRRVGRDKLNFPAPGLVRDYQRWMGGVDIHDQLRMQRYSVQLAYEPRKYYRANFFGLVDMAIVNAFIVHRYYMKMHNQKAPEHFKFMETLHEQLLAVDDDKFLKIEAATRAEDRTAASPARSGDQGEHYMAQCPDYVGSKKGRKRVARSCKVCAVYKVKPRKFTKYYCPGCSVDNLRKYLCNVSRPGNAKSCWHIWHEDWGNGLHIPEGILEGRRVQDHRPGKKRSRTSRRVDLEEAGEGEGGQSSGEGESCEETDAMGE